MEDPLPSSASVNLFDSSACLLYLAEKWDKEGVFSGKGDEERGAVLSWLMGYTAGLGATGKTWLMLLPKLPADSDALAILVGWIRKDYDVLEARLGEPGQEWIALGDRPTIADFAIWPHANVKVAAMAKIEFSEWPRLRGWSEKVAELGYVRKAVKRVGGFGHGGS
ncbi:glutathione S-transferase [Mytilinidion resinicola]|uniref:glutathione transferase n=1 Tax=Mytilinidion resinicola TaxID=574789 RepID=A0A6A6Z5C3_9PEZI|nr:glutathione S-transferase [Mytilinidion resinicola]KAF2815494.1 glutathione S-transferase [Mytilinidion resinicola]